MISAELIKKIEKGPLLLLLGQRYLSLNGHEDIILAKIHSKFQNVNITINNYDTLLSGNLSEQSDAFLAWAENLCKNISVPSWLESISHLPWSHIYTSAIDSVLLRAFITEWRKVQPIYDEKFRSLDPRNRFNLHISYLYGSISQIEHSKRIPLSSTEKIKRRFISNFFLQKIPEVLTPNGILIIDAYSDVDWLTIEDLYGLISQLSIGQALMFSVTESMNQNELIRILRDSGKIILYNESFSELISYLETEKKIHFPQINSEEFYGKWMSIGDRKELIPQDLINRVYRSATLIDDSLFYTRDFVDLDEKYNAFKHFLSSSVSAPNWSGYKNGFAFKRDYYEQLKSQTITNLTSNNFKDLPIILYGQSSSGKTISLGQLAFEISQEHAIPVLFIEKRNQKIDEVSIDDFCQWAETKDAKNTLIIWDGMVDPSLYQSLLRKLNTRGRNIVLVGSSYAFNNINKDAAIFIESPIELSEKEKHRFVKFLSQIDPILSNILSGSRDLNMLAMLYRYIPSSRSQIRSGLKSEFDFFSRLIKDSSTNSNMNNTQSLTQLLVDAGLFDSHNGLTFNEEVFIDSEKVILSDQLIFLIMVPGQYALSVPYELLLRAVGFETLSSDVFKVLAEVDLIIWSEDSQGNIMLAPRTAIEARILSNYLGGVRAEVEYIKQLLRVVKTSDFTTFGNESSPELNFATDLLNVVSPNTTERYFPFLYDITEVLKELRENLIAYHPRLILKEASFLREIAKGTIQIPETSLVLLDRAEKIVRQALIDLREFKERTITTYLRVELASILGTKALEYGYEGDKDKAAEAYELLKEVNTYKFASNPENYNALDVLAWTTEYLINHNILLGFEKLNAEAEMISLFDMAEIEGISHENKDKFLTRKLKFFELIGKQPLADSAFQQLDAMGSAAGFYIRAKKMLIPYLNDPIGSEDGISAHKQAYEYLFNHFTKIKRDGKSLFLLLTTWWIMKTRSKLFSNERQTIPLDPKDWQFCHEIIDLLLSIGDQYYSATTIYLKAIAQFHIGQIKASLETFRLLDSETDFSFYGKRRIQKNYLASTEDGKPRIFSGEVKRFVSFEKNEKTGQLYIPELKEYIPFVLYEFGKRTYQAGETIDRLYIAFNFRGPIAVPFK